MVTTPAHAQLKSEIINQRYDAHDKLITDGVDNGKLTEREAERLLQQQYKIDEKIYRAERDGRISSREANDIKREQNRLERSLKGKLGNATAQPAIPPAK